MANKNFDIRHIVRIVAACLAVLPSVAVAQTDESDVPDIGRSQRLLDKVEQWKREAQAVLKNFPRPIPADPADRKVVIELETPVVRTIHVSDAAGQWIEHRVFVAKLRLINLTTETKTIEPPQIKLMADGNWLKNGEIEPRTQGADVQVGEQSFPLGTLKPTPVQIASGRSGSTWIVFGGLPRGAQIPKLQLSVSVGEKPIELDINAWSAAKLGLSSRRLGPRGCLALLTIEGELNPLSYGALLEELARLAQQKVTRVVIRWSKSAPPIDLTLSYWFLGAVQSNGRNEYPNQPYSSPPNSFTELRLAELPFANRSSVPNLAAYGGVVASPAAMAAASPIHATTAEAVVAALRTGYEILPRNELLAEIRTGDVLTRCAALVAGGARLASDDLPLLLELADDLEPSIQSAALYSLRHFGEPAAINKLLQHVRGSPGPIAAMAAESLAASRYADAHDALLTLLEREGTDSRKAIVMVLAQNPRPIFSETIYKYVRDPQSSLGVEGLQALIRIGHPKLREVLQEMLDAHDPALRSAAYQELANQSDPEIEAALLRHTLKQLEAAPPTPMMLAFLVKTTDQSVVPLLLTHLKKMNSDRFGLINTLAQIGDQTVADALAEYYTELKSQEKVLVLGLLGQFRSPQFLKLAGPALESNDAGLVSTVCQWLQTDPTAAATQLLIAALDKSTSPNTLPHITSALGQIATADARKALRKAVQSGDSQKKAYAQTGLRILASRSPGMLYVQQGYNAEQEGQPEKALEFFAMAIKMDPELPEAYTVRANLFLKQNKFADARKDFEKALSLDDSSSEAVTGVGITLAIAGKFEEGIKLLEDNRAKFQNDGLFLYNAACVYGRAAEAAQKDLTLGDRDKKIAEFQRHAIDDLRQSLKLGFDQIDWMKKDPDLNSLHDLPEFKELTK